MKRGKEEETSDRPRRNVDLCELPGTKCIIGKCGSSEEGNRQGQGIGKGERGKEVGNKVSGGVRQS